MKRLIIFMLICLIVLYAYRSLPSDAVGLRKIHCVNYEGLDYHFISLPFNSGMDSSNHINPTGDKFRSIWKWNANLQYWSGSSYSPYFGWVAPFPITEGQSYEIGSLQCDFDLIFNGKYEILPQYNLVTNGPDTADMNLIMVPLEKYDLLMAGSGLGNDIGYCRQVARWDPVLHLSRITLLDPYGFYWQWDYPISIGEPIYVEMTADVTWPYNDKKPELQKNKWEPYAEITFPKDIYYNIVNAEGDGFDYSQSTITFKAWVTGREDDILTESSYGCGLEQITDSLSAIYINLGNFKNKWLPDDVVNFLVTESVNVKSPFKLEGCGSYIVEKSSDAAFRGFNPLVKGSGEPIVVGTPINSEENIPYQTELYQNYPNPFNPVTTIKFTLRTDCKVKLNVFNYKGQVVKELVNSVLVKGLHKVDFNASELSSGMYFYSLEADNMKLIKKMVLVR